MYKYGSVEPKRYSVDFSINLSFHLDYLVINFSTYSIYVYKEDLALNNLQKLICDKTQPNQIDLEWQYLINSYC